MHLHQSFKVNEAKISRTEKKKKQKKPQLQKLEILS